MNDKSISDPLMVGTGYSGVDTPHANIKQPNYTEDQVKEMKARYKDSPCRDTVNAIAKDFGKSERSIIAKLSNLGDYIAPKRTTKAGTPIIKKETLVELMEDKLDAKFPSLVKANKKDLETLLATIYEWLGEDDAELIA